ncbi:MAG TPA: hypothetical protein VLM20_06915, partial [Methylophilaceae bacterium]|nr:hypothetical protein [Methylophilaceae bacterium]
MKAKQKLIGIALLSALSSFGITLQAEEAASFKEAITEGKFSANMKFRWENVNQKNNLDDANAYTLRTLIGYETKSINGFSINTQIYGLSPFNDDYNDAKKGDPITSRRTYSVIADPEDYDFHQIYLQWAN